MAQIPDHPHRYALTNELHARPFPTLKAPGQAVFLAIKREHHAVGRDKADDLAHLRALLDRYGAPHPQPGATHYSGEIGAHRLKWESHTEFVTYTVFMEGAAERAFDPAQFDVFPADWLAAAPGVRMTSALLHVVEGQAPQDVRGQLDRWFVGESLAVSEVLDAAAVIAGDFRIDPAGHMRFAVFLAPGTGPQRAGRIVQRLCEIETYKTMAMLGFRRVREMQPELGALDRRLSELVTGLDASDAMPETSLHRLMEISAEGERMSARSSFRFGATGAYEAIVNQRIEVLRETRVEGHQTFGEFMMRRFDPAMRTVTSTRGQIETLATRAQRASELLRTQVDVARAAQNQALLASMDRRADMALRLQQTVEGLSVVAISYYAVNLLAYALAPLAKGVGIEKSLLTAGLVPVVVLAVWWVVRRIRKAMH